MPSKRLLLIGALAASIGAGACVGFFLAGDEKPAEDPSGRYEQRTPPNREGIGKFYLGREIAHPVGHRAAAWLERPEREEEEKPAVLMDLLDLKPGMVVADVGAGTGYISSRLARRILPGGRVLAVDIDDESLRMLEASMKEQGIGNVTPVLGTITDPNLEPNSVDLAVMVDVYHEMSHPFEMLGAIKAALKPDGRVVFVEYRAEDPKVPMKRLHKMTADQVKREAAVHDLQFEKSRDELPWQHVLFFQR